MIIMPNEYEFTSLTEITTGLKPGPVGPQGPPGNPADDGIIAAYIANPNSQTAQALIDKLEAEHYLRAVVPEDD